MINVTATAEEYLSKLIAKKDFPCDIRIFVSDPGTPKAETCLAFCKENENQETDLKIKFSKFDLYIEERSVSFLDDAEVNYDKDNFGGQLTIKAPSARVPKIGDDATLEDKVNYVLYDEINPQLASHGGNVHLEEITKDNMVVLQFGGGCQGCGMVDVTLKEGIEKTLLEKVPEIKGIRDVTDHTNTENAYYK
ncbi:MAG: Fe/S biogenesis protein NfuA [Gammaproteobacteria bacterium]|nr:Fe/S biogenesis protein NfuA [Gammaproteobacteria bacterium]|tara:strand:- start:941 stop:1519 length:579 start_codon:yes stop_codon:yes gene_type:complete